MSYTVTSVVHVDHWRLLRELIRAQLSTPNNSLVSLAQYNELFIHAWFVMNLPLHGPLAPSVGHLANHQSLPHRRSALLWRYMCRFV